jgi:hypothetical protein
MCGTQRRSSIQLSNSPRSRCAVISPHAEERAAKRASRSVRPRHLFPMSSPRRRGPITPACQDVGDRNYGSRPFPRSGRGSAGTTAKNCVASCLSVSIVKQPRVIARILCQGAGFARLSLSLSYREGMERRVAHPVPIRAAQTSVRSLRHSFALRSAGTLWRRVRAPRRSTGGVFGRRAALCPQSAVVLPPARALRLLAGSRSCAPRAGLERPAVSQLQAGTHSGPGRSPGAARELRLTRPQRAGAASGSIIERLAMTPSYRAGQKRAEHTIGI